MSKISAGGCVRYILGSRSPRRRELLGLVVPAEWIVVLPPLNAEEKGFDDCQSLGDIEFRLEEIATDKLLDVAGQVHGHDQIIIVADTTVVGFDRQQKPVVLGQPPTGDDWKKVVKNWFEEYYFDREHLVMTGLKVMTPEKRVLTRVVTTKVKFSGKQRDRLDWYLSTGESLGKAGGYGIQGGGSVFLETLTGSLTNVIGMPVEALLECLEEVKS